MIALRSPMAFGVIALALAGAGAIFWGQTLDQRAIAGSKESAFHAVSRTRALDRMSFDETVDHDQLRAWQRDARDPQEREVLEALSACEGAAACDSARRRAREHYAEALERAWAASQDAADRAGWATGAGVLSLAGALLLAIASARRGVPKAPPAVSPEAPPDAEPAAQPEVEALLRRRLEELYAARLRAWESDRFAAYGELAAGLSHGLKTPLASIRAATQVAIRRLGQEHPATPQLYDVIAEVDALVEQIKRFLAATGSGEPVPARVAPGQLVDAIESSYASEAAERGVNLRCEVDDSLGEVLVDAALLEMALRNLVENALAVAPEGSTVRVYAGPTEPPSRVGLDNVAPASGRWCEIVIADEGPGIPSEALGTGPVESTKANGSGLGLAIARRITARHGGALLVDTSPTDGTSVRAVLPAAPEEGRGVRA